MPRFKIEDLPVVEDLTEKQVKGIFGGSTALGRENSIECVYFEDSIHTSRDDVSQLTANSETEEWNDHIDPWNGTRTKTG